MIFSANNPEHVNIKIFDHKGKQVGRVSEFNTDTCEIKILTEYSTSNGEEMVLSGTLKGGYAVLEDGTVVRQTLAFTRTPMGYTI